MGAILRRLDAVVGAAERAGMWLALPMSLLLFLQWPLRDAVGAWSREANDLAQVAFALYVAIAVSAATRHRAHVAADVLAVHYHNATRRRIARIASLVVLLPWSAFVLFVAWPGTVQSVRQLEGFPETFNPGYFMIRIALVLLALLVLAQATLDVLRPARDEAP